MKRFISSLLAGCMIAALPNVTTVRAENETGAVEKEETVYIVTDASGKAGDVIVSEWLKNGEGRKEINDVSFLENIENVSGEETFEKTGNDGLVWKSEGKDICYQGKTDKELPIAVSVTYQLDGQKITPEDLKGKSGHVKIRFDYENKTETTVTVRGRKETAKMPFAVISGMQLPADHFRNVKVTNGKLISDGKNSFVIGMAFPDFMSALALRKGDELYGKLQEINIPDYIEVEADAENFDLGMVMSMATSDISSLLQNKNIDASFSADMKKLTDSTDELVSGTKQLKDGTSALKDGSKELYDGTAALKNGTSDLKNGLGEINEGSKTLKDGTGTLAAGAHAMKDGTGELQAGVTKAADGISQLKDGSDALKDGTATLKNGAAELSNGSESVHTGAAQLSAGTGELKEKTAQLSDGAGTLSAGADSLAAGVEKLSGGISQVDDGLAQVQSGAGEFSKKLDSGMDQLSGGISDAESGAKTISSGLSDAYAGAETIAAKLPEIAAGAGALQQSINDNAASLAGAVSADAQDISSATSQIASAESSVRAF